MFVVDRHRPGTATSKVAEREASAETAFQVKIAQNTCKREHFPQSMTV